jgi:flagellar basal-body rod protein FlgB
MGPSALSDLTTRALQQALRGLTTQRQAIADNVANSETPGYLANTVSFKDSLAQALADGTPESMNVSTARSQAPTNMNGNNVSVDQEFVNLSENQLDQQLAVEALNAKFRLLRTSITGV